eukprot:COSAG04_NODE_2376_length_4245_cov_2.906175_3_plen_188_part_00
MSVRLCHQRRCVGSSKAVPRTSALSSRRAMPGSARTLPLPPAPQAQRDQGMGGPPRGAQARPVASCSTAPHRQRADRSSANEFSQSCPQHRLDGPSDKIEIVIIGRRSRLGKQARRRNSSGSRTSTGASSKALSASRRSGITWRTATTRSMHRTAAASRLLPCATGTGSSSSRSCTGTRRRSPGPRP